MMRTEQLDTHQLAGIQILQNMPNPPKPKDPVYSFRAIPQVEDAIERHFQRLTKSTAAGVTIRRTDVIASLVIIGAAAWDASDGLGPHSPGSIIDAGEQVCRKALADLEAFRED